MTYNYKPTGVCTRAITVELDGGVIRSVAFNGGCAGNLAGISRLVEGMRAEEVIAKFKGTKCGYKATSCPDQLAKALEEALAS
ncbi:MAG: TIGR03905 family TSCPD domain-containing protein [Firmicutes bacterium]|nr:TIGR03905 family TSCPD domain-containing protein [Bacillota bacterium]